MEYIYFLQVTGETNKGTWQNQNPRNYNNNRKRGKESKSERIIATRLRFFVFLLP